VGKGCTAGRGGGGGKGGGGGRLENPVPGYFITLRERCFRALTNVSASAGGIRATRLGKKGESEMNLGGFLHCTQEGGDVVLKMKGLR